MKGLDQMDEILCTGQVTDIAALIDACQFPGDSLVLFERLPQRVIADERERYNLLQFAHLSNKIELAHSTSGRVFSQNFELRWQEENGHYQVVYLGEERKIPGLEQKQEVLAELKIGEQKKYYLFGELLSEAKLKEMGLENEPDSPYYAEVRIPRLLRYPKKAQRVRVVVREYIHKETGQVQLFRFQDLDEGV